MPNSNFVSFYGTPSTANVAAYSPDRVSWTYGTSPPVPGIIKDVISSNTSIIGVGTNNTILRSTNGINWSNVSITGTSYNFDFVTNNFYSVIGETRYVAITAVSASQRRVFSSNNDGSTWAVKSPLTSSYIWSDFVSGNSLPYVTRAGNTVASIVGVAFSDSVYSTTNAFALSETGGDSWNYYTLPSYNNWVKVVNGNSYWIVASISGSTCRSDFSTDFVSSGSIGFEPAGLAFGNGKFVAISYSNTAAYSTNNGSSWTSVSLPITATWKTLTFTGDVFLASSNGNAAVYSNDGITRKSSTMLNNNSWVSGPSLHFLKILDKSYSALAIASKINSISFSKNAISTAVSTCNKLRDVIFSTANAISTAAFNFSYVFGVAFDSAVCNSTSSIIKNVSSKVSSFVLSISDATPHITFYNRVFSATSSSVSTFSKLAIFSKVWAISWFVNKWVGIKAATSKGAVSTDGSTWTKTTLPVNQSWTGIASSGTINTAIAMNSNVAISSTDGVSWSTRSLPSSKKWKSLAFGANTFVGIATGSNACIRSTDGITWNEHSLPVSTDWCSIAHNGTIFCAISSTGRYAATSTDRITWSASAALPDNVQYNSITWALGQFTAVASGPTNLAAKSTDGITWARIYMPLSADWTDVGPGIGNPNV